MHGCTDRHFAGFQVQVPQSLAILQHAPNEAVYFFFPFSAKCSAVFFQLLQLVFILDYRLREITHEALTAYDPPDRTQRTDPVVDLDWFLGQADKRVVSVHLFLCLFHFRRPG